MTCKEFSEEFDILLNSYGVPVAFGQANPLLFDEYEKSLFLTKAQEAIVTQLYNGKLLGHSFEETEELRMYLESLIRTESIDPSEGEEGLSNCSVFFKLPDDVLFRTYEAAILRAESSPCIDGKRVEVIPVTQDEYHRIKDNPFRGANNRRVLRVDCGADMVELISNYQVSEYQLRYLAKPTPIILIDLPDDLTINKKSKETECSLNPAIHRAILELAVSLAVKSKGIAGKS